MSVDAGRLVRRYVLAMKGRSRSAMAMMINMISAFFIYLLCRFSCVAKRAFLGHGGGRSRIVVQDMCFEGRMGA